MWVLEPDKWPHKVLTQTPNTNAPTWGWFFKSFWCLQWLHPFLKVQYCLESQCSPLLIKHYEVLCCILEGNGVSKLQWECQGQHLGRVWSDLQQSWGTNSSMNYGWAGEPPPMDTRRQRNGNVDLTDTTPQFLRSFQLERRILPGTLSLKDCWCLSWVRACQQAVVKFFYSYIWQNLKFSHPRLVFAN